MYALNICIDLLLNVCRDERTVEVVRSLSCRLEGLWGVLAESNQLHALLHTLASYTLELEPEVKLPYEIQIIEL